MSVQAAERVRAGLRPADWAPFAVIGAVLAAELVAILLLNGGMIVYSLDDPYIHLALAENIARGQYGINLSEASAPSSSILWPFLLVPFAGTGFHDEWPLVINVASALATVGVLQAIIHRVFPPGAVPYAWLPSLVVVLVALVFHIVGLVFTGMEHSLQVLLAVLLVLGLVVETEKRAVPWYLPAAIVLGPLVRYESLALSAGALLYLGLRGRPALAAGLCGLTALPLVAFSAFLLGLGLEWLPSSVLVKSEVAPANATIWDLAQAMARSMLHSYGHRFRLILLVFAALFAWRAWRGGAAGQRALASAGLVIVLAHLVGGKYGWFGRYEAYVMVSAAMLLCYVWRDAVVAWLHRCSPVVACVAVLTVAILVGPLMFLPTAMTPLAANNIYEQQYQMNRFLVEFAEGEPVAVNDLGWVSFRNDGYVLDLWGLGSVEAGARRVAREPGWMDDMAARNSVRLAMLYDDWFAEQVPAHWQRLGILRLGRMRVTPAQAEVTFYATDPAAAVDFSRRLEEFARTLPDGVVFEPAALPQRDAPAPELS